MSFGILYGAKENPSGNPVMSMEHPYPEDKVNVYNFTNDTEIPGDFASIDKTAPQWWTDYLFFGDRGFVKKPEIKIIVDGVNLTTETSDLDSIVLKINTDYTAAVIIISDIDIPEVNTFIQKIKLKDRNSFLADEARMNIDHIQGQTRYEFPLRSNFPGIAMLRAKDEFVLCKFKPLQVKFSQ